MDVCVCIQHTKRTLHKLSVNQVMHVTLLALLHNGADCYQIYQSKSFSRASLESCFTINLFNWRVWAHALRNMYIYFTYGISGIFLFD